MGDDDVYAPLDRPKGPCHVHSSREAFDMPVRNALVGKDFLHGGPAHGDTPTPGGHLDGRTALLALQHTDRPIMRQYLRPLVDLGGHLKDPTNIAVDLNAIFCMHRSLVRRRHLFILSSQYPLHTPFPPHHAFLAGSAAGPRDRLRLAKPPSVICDWLPNGEGRPDGSLICHRREVTGAQP